MSKKKKQSRSKSLVSKKENQNLVFAGASRLMKSPTNSKENNERKMILTVAKAINISPLSFVIMGNLPYVDNKGRKEKLEAYSAGSKFEYNWVRRSEDDTDKAICEARIVTKSNKALTPWIAGECSPASIKMSTLKGYQNHMAQTRAENRAFEYLYGIKLRNELIVGIQKMMTSGEVDPQIGQKSLSAGGRSAEEWSGDNKEPQAPVFDGKSEISANKKEIDELIRTALTRGFSSEIGIVAGVNRLLKLKVKIKSLDQLSKIQISSVMVALLQKPKKQ